IYTEGSHDTVWIEKFTNNHETFYDFIQEGSKEALLETIGLDMAELELMLTYMQDKKVVFLVGTGVQKYVTGTSTFHAIDSLAALLGLFGKEGSGVHYLGNSKLGFKNPFAVKCKTVSKVVTAFSEFDTVLVQGGNPAESMPDSIRVGEELNKVENLIYFGLYENETSRRAKIVIPAKNFFEKEDVRLSYGHQYVEKMNRVVQSEIGISEYDFTKKLFDAFEFEGLESEASYIRSWLGQCTKENGNYISPAYEEIPYKEGFGEEGEDRFEFIKVYDDDFIKDERLWLLSPKTNKALNTQFKRDNKVQLHPSLGYAMGEMVRITSEYGTVDLEVVLNKDLRLNCVIVSSNTLGLNILTPSIVSEEGENACYQEVKVTIKRV
ncbi:MAG: molybdopterin-dependent oxidoreductase, partial [Flavobacteriaceae bacterium]|nr:molybdopterin-dependent oxidoreductase [Flavobacteriaceae bacterium]